MSYDPVPYWERRAERFGAPYVGPLGDPHESERERQEFEAWLAGALPTECGTLLDFGCGSGRLSASLAKRADIYVGVDIVEAAIGLAQHAHPQLQYRTMRDVVPVDPRSVDTLVASVVFQHIPGDQWLVWCLEIRRALKKGATVAVIDNREGTAAHMYPRGAERIAADLALEVPRVDSLGTHDAFVGRFKG